MLKLVLALLVILILLVINEFWWHTTKRHDELNRKFIHITVGSFVAFWPYLLDWNEIKVLSTLFIIVVLLARQQKFLSSIRSVERSTWGDVFFAIVVGLLAFVTTDKAIYTISLLQMSLADGMAAVIGTLFGKGNTYKVGGNRKSIIGTTTFFAVSIVSFLVYALTGHPISAPVVISVVAASTVIENLAPIGLDNLLIPLVVTLILHGL